MPDIISTSMGRSYMVWLYNLTQEARTLLIALARPGKMRDEREVGIEIIGKGKGVVLDYGTQW